MASLPIRRWVIGGAALLCGLAGYVAGASAGQPMITGGLTSQPIGHYEFCKSNPSECDVRGDDFGPAHLNAALWRAVVSTNASVNKAVRPMNDEEIYGKPEVWAYPTKAVGDCEDYVLEKQRELVERGVSMSNLLITVVRKPDGEGHAVLTLRTDEGDFILDNLTDKVREWDQTNYRFLKRQSSNDSGRWVAIREGQAPTVASVQ